MQATPKSESVARLRVGVVVLGELGDRMAGPSIRGWELAQALATTCQVTVLATVPAPRTEGSIAVEPYGRATLHGLAGTRDAIICPWLPPLVYLTRAHTRAVLVADLYDPAEVEIKLGDGSAAASSRISELRALTELQLRFADLVMCGADRQRHMIEAKVPRRTDGQPLPLVVVPLGMPAAPSPSVATPIRARFRQINPSDEVILWWGTPWRWLDGGTALRAFASLLDRRPGVRLVFTGATPLGAAEQAYNATDQLCREAADLGLLDRHVFFIDDWIPYAHRHEYLLEADLGLTLHRDETEGRLAMRARSRDYAWAQLPCVLGRGDQLADRLAATGLAQLVETGDVVGTTRALEQALDRGLTAQTRERLARLSTEMTWPRLVDPLQSAIEHASPGRSWRRDLSLVARVPRYYAQRARHRAFSWRV